MQNEILEVLKTLDPAKEEHWTDDGLPSLEFLSKKMNVPVKRVDVTNAAPHFTKENPQLDVVSGKKEEKLDVLAKEVSSAEMELEKARKQLEKAQRAVSEAQAKHDSALEKQKTNSGVDSNIEEIQKYLKKQADLREEAHGRAKKLIDAGIDLSLFSDKAPIDKAMARKTGFGHERPSHKVKEQGGVE